MPLDSTVLRKHPPLIYEVVETDINRRKGALCT